jgi:2-phosphosulfolactate phosphatase
LYFDQSKFNVRCEWGLQGVRLVGREADVVIIVDVLSFSTSVDVATSRGAKVFPYRWNDGRAREYAIGQNAELACPRGKSSQFSLSPASMRNAVEGSRIVLPSPNGSELTVEAAALGRNVLTGCFRNCRTLAKYAATLGGTIAVIAAGERWPDGTLRPAVEDLAAAGAIISHLSGARSSEASGAAAVWNSVKANLALFLAECASGRELIEGGFEGDVTIAAEADVSQTIPVFQEGAYARFNASR